MKKFIPIFLALIASLGLLSCDVIPQPQQGPDGSQYQSGPALEILSKTDVFSPQGGVGTIVVNTTQPLSVRSDRGWIDVAVSGNRATLTVSRNESIESRYSSLILKAGDASAEIIVQQFGINSAYAWDESYSFPFAGGELVLPYGDPGTVWVDVSELKWLTADVDEVENTITFTAKKSIYNYERKGDVRITIGDAVDRTIRFIQEPNPSGIDPGEDEPLEFTLQSDWTPKYVEPESPDAPTTVVGVDVAEDSHAGRYFIKVIPESEFTGDEDLFLNRNAFAWAKEGPQIFRTSSTLEIEKLELGSYRVYAIGVDNQNVPNGTYAVATFSVTKVLTPFEKFLGTWSVTRGDYEDTWTIEEKEPGKSYTIKGLESFAGDFPITATFDATDNTMHISAMAEMGSYTFTSSDGEHTAVIYFCGTISRSGSVVTVRGSYPIAVASITNKEEMTVTSDGSVKLSDGNTYPVIGMRYGGMEGTSFWTFDHSTPYTFPLKLKQLSQGGGSGGGGGGGGDDPSPGTGAYDKWIGTWNAGSGRTLKIEADEKDETYSVTDSGFGGFVYTTLFDKATGEMTFHTHQVYESGVDLYYFIGVDGNYLRFGAEEDNYLIARATLASSGSAASVKAVTYTQEGQQVSASALTILDYQTEDTDDYDAGWYGLTAVTDFALPASLTKASASSLAVTSAASRATYYDLETGVLIKPAARANKQKSRRIQ